MSNLIELITASTSFLFLILCLTPFLLALVLLFSSHRRELAIQLAPWAALPALLLALIANSNSQVFHFSWLLLGTEIGLDQNRSGLLGVTTLLWLIAGLFSRNFMAKDDRLYQFFIFFLLSMSGNIGVIVAQDAISFYSFFALMSFSAYGLVIYRRYDAPTKVQQASRIYIGFVIAGEMVLFIALLLAITAADYAVNLETIKQALVNAEQRDFIIALLLIGFGMKAGLLLCHVSLPITYQVLPVSGVIVMGGAMLHSGVLGWMQFLPLGYLSSPAWGEFLLIVGLISAFYGVLMGLMQRHTQALLAYSSISQIGLMLIIIGLGLSQALLWNGLQTLLFAFILHHTLAKGALFFGNGLMQMRPEQPKIRFWLLLSLFIPALIIAGAPLTTGALVKVELKLAVMNAPVTWIEAIPLLLSLSTLATTLLLIRFLWLTWHTLPAPEPYSLKIPSILLFAWFLLLLGLVVFSFTLQLYNINLLEPQLLWSNSWPILLGIALGSVVILLSRFKLLNTMPTIPAGDVFWIAYLLVMAAWRRFKCWLDLTGEKIVQQQQRTITTLDAVFMLPKVRLAMLEQQLLTWPVAGTLLLLLGLGILTAQLLVSS